MHSKLARVQKILVKLTVALTSPSTSMSFIFFRFLNSTLVSSREIQYVLYSPVSAPNQSSPILQIMMRFIPAKSFMRGTPKPSFVLISFLGDAWVTLDFPRTSSLNQTKLIPNLIRKLFGFARG